ncbi:pollen-specific leucine-rich repeat extensin-like protein 4 isoform X2 [Alosa alosa]|uniref:pollen-specific leucine-rich repeat extensin-like protein 4 isoform X2 n=1 Tax=Alosa alosa TaxID=278164 RepID=UPI0020155419|nr:pollen-specific leucine-rich repeat extensin-like protein 4 isoform X2 [Alosa alosa]
MLKQHANVVPSGLPTLLEGFSKAALKKRPSNLGFFAWYYFTELMKYKAENESFDLRKLVREFHNNLADRISGDGFEEELKKEGYNVTSNVDHEYNELCITGEVDLLSWGHQYDDTNNTNGAKSNVPPTAPPNSLVKSNDPGRAAGDTKQKIAQVKSQVDSVPLCPKSSLSIQKATDTRTRLPESPKQALNQGARGTACVHPLKDPPRNHTNTNAQHEVKPSACSTAMAVQTNPTGATTDTVTEQLSVQLKKSSLGPSDGTTEDRKRWAPYDSRDGDRHPPNSAQSQSRLQPQLQQRPETCTGPAGTHWCQPPEAHYHRPPPPHGPLYGCYRPGSVWFPPPPHFPLYHFWPPQGLYPWCPPCPCFMWPNMGAAMPRRCHDAPPGYPLRVCAPSQVPSAPCQNTPNSPDSTSSPDPVLLPVNQQSPSGCPRSLYPPAFGCASYYPGPMPQREGEMPTSNAPNRRCPYNPNCHIHPQF